MKLRRVRTIAIPMPIWYNGSNNVTTISRAPMMVCCHSVDGVNSFKLNMLEQLMRHTHARAHANTCRTVRIARGCRGCHASTATATKTTTNNKKQEAVMTPGHNSSRIFDKNVQARAWLTTCLLAYWLCEGIRRAVHTYDTYVCTVLEYVL